MTSLSSIEAPFLIYIVPMEMHQIAVYLYIPCCMVFKVIYNHFLKLSHFITLSKSEVYGYILHKRVLAME